MEEEIIKNVVKLAAVSDAKCIALLRDLLIAALEHYTEQNGEDSSLKIELVSEYRDITISAKK